MEKTSADKDPSRKGKPADRASRGFMIRDTYEKLKKDILSHKLGPGVKLTAEHLASSLDVSRTPIRQALERLNQEGYVDQIPGRGFFVAKMGADELRNLYDLRKAIEVHALSSAFEYGIAPDELRHLTELNRIYETFGTIQDGDLTAEDGKDIRNRFEADHAFHVALAALGRNQLICQKLDDIHERLSFRRRYDGYWFWTTKGVRAPQAAEQHRAILDAIARNDRDAALETLRTHLQNAWQNYEQFLTTISSYG